MKTKMISIENSMLSYKNFKKLLLSFVIYVDFECILELINIQNSTNVKSV